MMIEITDVFGRRILVNAAHVSHISEDAKNGTCWIYLDDDATIETGTDFKTLKIHIMNVLRT